eukprot:TRINITY_DN1852_c0_g2_i1.p1 TRINITY_DN1852_c0_g2~~TRINITY_DN1852_c0_g2_i1.p1  ORF type:complete len:636 (+),score=146.09 TRINITY_DN1852_c0_g2_i1:299-2206(+)
MNSQTWNSKDIFQQMFGMWSAWIIPFGLTAFSFKFLQRIINLPFIHKYWARFEDYWTWYRTVTVSEYDRKKQWSGQNELYNALNWWLNNRAVMDKMDCEVYMAENKNNGAVSVGPGVNVFVRVGQFSVRKIVKESYMRETYSYSEGFDKMPVDYCLFELTFPNSRTVDAKSFLENIAAEYLLHKQRTRTMHLYTLRSGYDGSEWQKTEFHHPMTISGLKMRENQRDKLRMALDSFKLSEDWYRENGTVWKTGFFLTGPPGTGKTSTAVAIANYLHYDIYLLSLTHIKSDIDLMELNANMGSKCVVLLEDADCFKVLHRRDDSVTVTEAEENKDGDRKRKGHSAVTLSAVLNFLDGVLSTVSKGRVFVMTSNHPEVIDPAIYRSGRLDHHFHMEACSFDQIDQMFDSYKTPSGEVPGVKCMLGSIGDKVKEKVDANLITASDVKSIILKHQWKATGDETEDIAECERASRAAIMELLSFEGTGDIRTEAEGKDGKGEKSKGKKKRGTRSSREVDWERELATGRLRSPEEEGWVEEILSGNMCGHRASLKEEGGDGNETGRKEGSNLEPEEVLKVVLTEGVQGAAEVDLKEGGGEGIGEKDKAVESKSGLVVEGDGQSLKTEGVEVEKAFAEKNAGL